MHTFGDAVGDYPIRLSDCRLAYRISSGPSPESRNAGWDCHIFAIFTDGTLARSDTAIDEQQVTG